MSKIHHFFEVFYKNESLEKKHYIEWDVKFEILELNASILKNGYSYKTQKKKYLLLFWYAYPKNAPVYHKTTMFTPRIFHEGITVSKDTAFNKGYVIFPAKKQINIFITCQFIENQIGVFLKNAFFLPFIKNNIHINFFLAIKIKKNFWIMGFLKIELHNYINKPCYII